MEQLEATSSSIGSVGSGSSGASETSSPVSIIENGKVNRVQLVALNEDFLSIDSMQDMNYSLNNAQSMYQCLYNPTNNDETLDVSLQALCLVQLAIWNQDRRLKEESMLMNGKALQKVTLGFERSKTAYATETLAASMCLKTYEVSS